ncbi:hypothetical protein ACFQH6_00945 [Halobacteriaceae archaeon GCM10025711]
MAEQAEPDSVSIPLAVTPAADLDVDLPPETPVFTDFYLPDAGGSVASVFGVDLGVPAGQTKGRFISHPLGDPEPSLTDDMHARLLIAVPPWETDSVAAFTRHGTRLRLVLLDVEPSQPSLA